MAWGNEVAFPVIPTYRLWFSPIINSVVYIIDWADVFYEYNIATHTYRLLTSPNFSGTNCWRSMSISPNGLRIATMSDQAGTAYNGAATRIEIYTIATDTWISSSQTPIIIAQQGKIRSIVWQDNDTLWAWVKDGTNDWGRCIRYTVSTDTWTEFLANIGGAGWAWNPMAAAMTPTVVYAMGIGASVEYWVKYTIATDTYSAPIRLANRYPCHASDHNRLWYYNTADLRQGYFDIADESQHNNQFSENTDRDLGYHMFCGIKDDLSLIIAHSLADSPWLMSEGTHAPLVRTDPATEIT